MENYTYQNTLISKKQLRQLLAWSFTKYDSMQACSLADDLKYLGFNYASQAGISISIEDLKVPFIKNSMVQKATQEIINSEKLGLKGKITDVEKLQKTIDTWSQTSDKLKNEVVKYFKNYDPLNSVYIMAFSGARGNLSQVRQLVGMRGLMSDPHGEILKLSIKKNFREGLTITDYLMSGYGARKGIVDTALKTANSGYLTRRLIDVAQDILIREKDCRTVHSFHFSINKKNPENKSYLYSKILGMILNRPIFDSKTKKLIFDKDTQITPDLITIFKHKKITNFCIRSPLTCTLYRAICQKCYGWDLATENLVDIGEGVGIIAGQSIGEPGTQLTMRTFHTGGIFTSQAVRQLHSSIDGVIKFSKNLKILLVRTNQGETVRITKNSGSLIIIPKDPTQNFVKIDLIPNTIVFNKNNQYVTKNTLICELENKNKQIKTEIKAITANNSGEIFVPLIKNQKNLLSQNKLLWILYGQVYQAPINSFINFYSDYKINKTNHVFRTKIINNCSGLVTYINKKKDLFQRVIKITNTNLFLSNCILQKIKSSKFSDQYLLNFKTQKYSLKLNNNNLDIFSEIKEDQNFAKLNTNKFKTLTGGILYYNVDINKNFKTSQNTKIVFHTTKKTRLSHNSIFWLSEETYHVNCDSDILLVEEGDFISKNFEIIPGIRCKISGIVSLIQKVNFIETISIKSGLVYKGKKFKNLDQKVFYPGETISNKIKIKTPSFCECIKTKNNNHLLIRPLEIYEISYAKSVEKFLDTNIQNNLISNFETKVQLYYHSGEKISSKESINLIDNYLNLKFSIPIKNKIILKYKNNKKKKHVNLLLIEQINLNNYLTGYLKYKDIETCLLVQQNQFIDSYTTLFYLERTTSKPLEIVKFKSKSLENKEILLISNNECIRVKKKEIKDKIKNDYILTLNITGKIINDNGKIVTIQKGRPYFFPNCENEALIYNNSLSYKNPISLNNEIPNNERLQRFNSIFINYYDLTASFLKDKIIWNKDEKFYEHYQFETKKIFLKKNGKLYSSAIPQFYEQFYIGNQLSKSKFSKFIKPYSIDEVSDLTTLNKDETCNIIIQNSKLNKNKLKQSTEINSQITYLKFYQSRIAKAVKLHSLTDDYIEQERNILISKHGEFIENDQTIGLVNFEKEITGDIVQGLPRIEELLEARKKKLKIKDIPLNQKKNLLVEKTSLDINFDFQKLGMPILENQKINPHLLLKVYFNYYGLIKSFSNKNSRINYIGRLLNNYNGSYHSFKKVQGVILNSVQSVYESQGVFIADKHLELIIKQMTTKVLITYEGNSTLLAKEVIDLYHIKYINQILETANKTPAYYVPFLLGISKAALNNPSFISSASFQETTKVLTKAAIEGRIDWLRGLKENIITGRLIPAGTGSQSYKYSFKNKLLTHIEQSPKLHKLKKEK